MGTSTEFVIKKLLPLQRLAAFPTEAANPIIRDQPFAKVQGRCNISDKKCANYLTFLVTAHRMSSKTGRQWSRITVGLRIKGTAAVQGDAAAGFRGAFFRASSIFLPNLDD
jgi:hypothetical protein